MSAKSKGPEPKDNEIEYKAKCGVIMPISETANRSEKHWADVQKLLHRAIINSGFEPINVWNNESTDRISERIIGNIYSVDLAVADISDLNPNVMLELGLRLASKKPTIVVVNSGGTIPFDIRDFHALHYPSDLNILEMESFFTKFSEIINARHEAYKEGTYTPFLGKVVVDVLSPETREVPLDSLIISRLDDIGSRIGRIERNNQKPIRRPISNSSEYIDNDSRIYLELKIPDNEKYKKIERFIDSQTPLMSYPVSADGTITRLRLDVIGEPLRLSEISPAIIGYADELGIPPTDIRFTVR